MQVETGRVWALHKLMAHDDEAFIVAAYSAALGRLPGATERFYLDHLRRGTSKTHILRELMRSEEGQRFGAHITGFAIPSALDAARSLPYAGVLISILADLMNLPGLTATTRGLQARVSQLAGIRSTFADTDSAERQLAAMGSHMTHMMDLKHQRLQREINDLADALSECAGAVTTLSDKDVQFEAALSSIRDSVEELKRSLAIKGERG